MNFKDKKCDKVDRIHVAQDTDQWQAVVNAIMNLMVPYTV
jgi:hypothetical protein